MSASRERVIQLYKTLLYMGRDYPKGYDFFRSKLKASFLKNKDEKDPEKISILIQRGEFVVKELEALYMLRKYRAMKHRSQDISGALPHGTLQQKVQTHEQKMQIMVTAIS